ncbi:MAG: hypothetical protein IJ958_04285 [Agathobacter sp.]|nr:hypothetical protein [Agathobacter sp.]
MKNFKNLILVTMCFTLFLSGCGGTKTNEISDSTDSNNSTNENENSIVEKDEYTFSEYISRGETIWFLTDGKGKDANVEMIYVLEADGTVYYTTSNWTLGEAEQKDDEQISSIVKQNYEEELREKIEKKKEDVADNTFFDGYGEGCTVTALSDISSVYDSYLTELKPGQYRNAVVTDSTGNHTEKEVFVYQESVPFMAYNNVGLICVVSEIELSYMYPDYNETNCFELYDSFYGGYIVYKSNIEYNENKDCKFFVTRIKNPVSFNLDDVGTENVGIDNVDSLFDRKDNCISVELEFDY